MTKFLFRGSYTQKGIQGVAKDGGTARVKAIEQALAGVGGTLESFYFAFGGDDFFVTADLPDAQAATGLALVIGSSGAANLNTTVLVTPEEVDKASKVAVEYRPPGA